MPIQLEVLENEPIIIAHYHGFVNAEEFATMYDDSLAIVEKMIEQGLADKVYRIGNTIGVQSDFMEVMKMAQTAAKRPEGGTNDPRILAILVGTEVWGRLFLNLVSQPQFGAMKIPFFKTVEEAIEYCRLDIREKQQKNA